MERQGNGLLQSEKLSLNMIQAAIKSYYNYENKFVSFLGAGLPHNV